MSFNFRAGLREGAAGAGYGVLFACQATIVDVMITSNKHTHIEFLDTRPKVSQEAYDAALLRWSRRVKGYFILIPLVLAGLGFCYGGKEGNKK